MALKDKKEAPAEGTVGDMHSSNKAKSSTDYYSPADVPSSYGVMVPVQVVGPYNIVAATVYV